MKPTHGVAAPAPEAEPPAQLLDALRRMGLVARPADARFAALPGGVSSDIHRVDAGGRTFCVKRALPKLRVSADWRAPVERNRYEVEWMRVASAIAPEAVPAILGEDREHGAFAMAWLPPERYPVWKTLLRDGHVDKSTAAAVGDVLGRIHAGTADRPELVARFRTDDIFHAIRLEPYLLATARAHPDLGPRLAFIAAVTAAAKRVLVHGDFSPKNILIGPDGPVVLDAECAWFGDPAFDLAFVLNHLLLKQVWHPGRSAALAGMYEALVAAYRAHVAWEAPAALDTRTAALLPGLMLARVDGKSPVEYLTDPADRERVRAFARASLASPPSSLAALLAAFTR